jgi:cobalt/nickel transport system ATP-binding protein
MPVHHKTTTPPLLRPAAPSHNGCGPEEAVVLRVEGLAFSYPDGHRALQDVSFCMQRGEIVALVGPNGAGKSTLLLHLNGILQGEGLVQIAGQPVEKGTLRLIRSQVGLVFQNPDDQLFSPTVFEDVAFGPLHLGYPEAEVHARVTRALSQVDMANYASRLSHHLSEGEKKRISIATVLAMDPEILVLDEPTAGLDPRARRALIGLLRDLPYTILVSTHDMALVYELCPRMVILDGGQIAADGPTAALMADPDRLEAHGLEQPLIAKDGRHRPAAPRM